MRCYRRRRMAKGRASQRVESLKSIAEAGDHGTARRKALELASDPSAEEAERVAASALAASFAPDRVVVVAGVAGIVVALAITAWQLAH
jgi:hypothetical protein